MVTSVADSSKISFEQSIAANATGFKVRSRGMSRDLQYTGDVLKIGGSTTSRNCASLVGRSTMWTPLTNIYCVVGHPTPSSGIT